MQSSRNYFLWIVLYPVIVEFSNNNMKFEQLWRKAEIASRNQCMHAAYTKVSSMLFDLPENGSLWCLYS